MSGSWKVELEPEGEENHEEAELQPYPQLHPLIIPEIVRGLVKFVGTEDLTKCRLVCQLWNEEIIPHMKIRSTFSFETPDEVEDFLVNGKQFFGFRRSKLKFGTWTSEAVWETKLFNFLSSHGKLLQEVELDFGSVLPGSFTIENFREVCLASFQDLQCLKLTNLPCPWTHELLFAIVQPQITFQKLTTLEISVDMRVPCTDDHFTPTENFYVQLLSLGPNLEEVHMSKSEGENWTASIAVCLWALVFFTPTNLKRLYLHGPYWRPFAAALAHSTLDIQKLAFDNFEGLKVNFESNTLGSQIEIVESLHSLCSGVPAGDMKDFIEARGSKFERGISCTQLLRTFMAAYQDRVELLELTRSQVLAFVLGFFVTLMTLRELENFDIFLL